MTSQNPEAREWQEAYDNLFRQNECLQTENKALREALEPFAREAKHYDGAEDHEPLRGGEETNLVAGDLRVALSALHKEQQHDEGD